ncbi:MAG: hypothetical protein M0036_04450 [Desulfobacteraceae bacterium]|nr:hypothetical protein [Desulfobacteraceae bacterium]
MKDGAVIYGREGFFHYEICGIKSSSSRIGKKGRGGWRWNSAQVQVKGQDDILIENQATAGNGKIAVEKVFIR